MLHKFSEYLSWLHILPKMVNSARGITPITKLIEQRLCKSSQVKLSLGRDLRLGPRSGFHFTLDKEIHVQVVL